MSDKHHQPHSRVQIPASSHHSLDTHDCPLWHPSATRPSSYVPHSQCAPASSSASATPQKDCPSDPRGRACSPSSCAAAVCRHEVVNSPVCLPSSPQASPTSPGIVSTVSPPHTYAVSSFLSTSASSCEVGLDSPRLLPPTPPSSPVSAHSQSTPYLGVPLTNLAMSLNAEGSSSTTASAPSSPNSSHNSVATRCSTQQPDVPGGDKPTIPPAESPLAAVSSCTGQTHQFASSAVTPLPSLTLQSTCGWMPRPAAVRSTLKRERLLHASTSCTIPVHPPPLSNHCFPQRLSFLRWSQQPRECCPANTASRCLPAAEEPFLSGMRNTSDSNGVSNAHPCRIASCPFGVHAGTQSQQSINFPPAAVFSAQFRSTRRIEISRAPWLLFLLLSILLILGVTVLFSFTVGWPHMWPIYINRFSKSSGANLIYEKDATAAIRAPSAGLQGLAPSPAAAAAAESRSSAWLPEVFAGEAPSHGFDGTEHGTQKMSSNTSASPAYEKRGAVRLPSHAEERFDNVPSLTVSRWSKAADKPRASVDAADGLKQVLGSAVAAVVEDVPFLDAVSSFLSKRWDTVTRSSTIRAPESPGPQANGNSSPDAAAKCSTVSRKTPLYRSENQQGEDGASARRVYAFLSKAFTLAKKWIITVKWCDYGSFEILPGRFRVLLAVSVCCCLCCLFFSGSLVYKHLTNYYEPHLQRYICRICLIAPAFAISSLTYFVHTLPNVVSYSSTRYTAAHTFTPIPDAAVSIENIYSYPATARHVSAVTSNNAVHADSGVPWSSNASTSVGRQEEVFVEFLRDLAQAVALYSFLALMTNCCGGDRCISLTVACNPNKVSPVPPLNLFFRPFHPGPHILRYLRIGVMQCVIVVPLVGVLSLLQVFSSDTYALHQKKSWTSAVPFPGLKKAAAVAPTPHAVFVQTSHRDSSTPPGSPSYKNTLKDVETASTGLVADTAVKRETANTAESPYLSYADGSSKAEFFSSRGNSNGYVLPLGVELGKMIPWGSLLLLCSVTICMFSLLQFYVCTESLLRPYKPLQKFLSIKFLVFFQVWQKVAIHVLLNLTVIKVNDVLNPEDMADLYHNVMMGAWTIAVSISHMLCFPLKDHRPEMPREGDPPPPPGATLLQSLLDVFLAVDVLHDAREMALVQHPSLDRACSLLLDQSVEAYQDGRLAACINTPQSMPHIIPSPSLQHLLQPEELSRSVVISSEDYPGLHCSSRATPLSREYLGSEVAAGKRENPSYTCPASTYCEAQPSCGHLQNVYQPSPSDRRSQSSNFQMAVDSLFPKASESCCSTSRTANLERDHITPQKTTSADTSTASAAAPFPPSTDQSILVTSDDSREEGNKHTTPVKVVVTSMGPEVPAHSSVAAAPLNPPFSSMSGNVSQHSPVQTSSHTLMASLGTPALLLPPTWSLADTPLHFRNITPPSDSQALRSSGHHLCGVERNTAVHSLWGSPAERGVIRQLSPRDAAAAAAAAAVAAATSRTPLSATAKAAAAARFVFTSGTNSPFHDCPAAALAAALGDFDTPGSLTSVAVAVAARQDGDNLGEGEEGGLQQGETDASLRAKTSASTFLSRLTSAYASRSSSNSSSSSSWLTDTTSRVGTSRGNVSGHRSVESGSSALDDTDRNQEGEQDVSSDGEHISERCGRSRSSSPRGCESRVRRTRSDGSATIFSHRNSLASSHLGSWNDKMKEEVSPLRSPVFESVATHQEIGVHQVHNQMHRQQRVGRCVASFLNWATQKWACRSIPTLSNARERLASVGSNLRRVGNTHLSVSNSFHSGGSCRPPSALNCTGFGKGICSAEADTAGVWGLKGGESHELLVQALTQQQELWASPPHRARSAECVNEQVHKDHEGAEATATPEKRPERRNRPLRSQSRLEEGFNQAGTREKEGCRSRPMYEGEEKEIVVTTRGDTELGQQRNEKTLHSLPQQEHIITLNTDESKDHNAPPLHKQKGRPVKMRPTFGRKEPNPVLQRAGVFPVCEKEQTEKGTKSQRHQPTEGAHQQQQLHQPGTRRGSAGDERTAYSNCRREQFDQRTNQDHTAEHAVDSPRQGTAKDPIDSDAEKKVLENQSSTKCQPKHTNPSLGGWEETPILKGHTGGNQCGRPCQAPALPAKTLGSNAKEIVSRNKRASRTGRRNPNRRDSNQVRRYEAQRLAVKDVRHEVAFADGNKTSDREILTGNQDPSEDAAVFPEKSGVRIDSSADPPEHARSRSPVCVDLEEEDKENVRQLKCAVGNTVSSVWGQSSLLSGSVTCSAVDSQKYLGGPDRVAPDNLRIRRIGWSIETAEQEQGETLEEQPSEDWPCLMAGSTRVGRSMI